MENNTDTVYKGAFMHKWFTALFGKGMNNSVWGRAMGDELQIKEDRLQMKSSGHSYELKKGDITNISSQIWVLDGIRIEHTNPTVPSLIFFRPFLKKPVLEDLKSKGFMS